MTIRKEKGNLLMKRNVILHIAILSVCMCFCFGVEVHATSTDTQTQTTQTEVATQGYVILETELGLTCTYNGVLQQNKYFAVTGSETAYTVVKPCTKKSFIYYFDENGVGTVYKSNGFISVTYSDSTNTYFCKKGTLLTNTIAGNKTQGYYYVDSTGVKVTKKEIKQAVKFVRAHTKTSWSKSKKLKACYDYLWKNYNYERFYDKPKASKMPSYAKYMFSKKRGNCYRYAASLAYIAKVIGYDSRVVSGAIPSLSGGMSPHGWTEIKMNGEWYIFDANMQKNFPTVDSYKKTSKTYPYKHEIYDKYKMTVKNGKVTWK